jgi:hypothetical protein
MSRGFISHIGRCAGPMKAQAGGFVPKDAALPLPTGRCIGKREIACNQAVFRALNARGLSFETLVPGGAAPQAGGCAAGAIAAAAGSHLH